jgi:L,D-transpeptidase catalytic domain
VKPLRRLNDRQWNQLSGLGWSEFVGSSIGIWVSLQDQRLRVVHGRSVVRCYLCSTARSGSGNVRDSFCTPLGWHEIGEAIGKGLPKGAILQGRQWTGEVWRADQTCEEDYVLSRVLRLRGLQEGSNCGGEVDTWSRFIYIHGTNEEALLGQPASHGCIRMANDDVIELFELVEVGCRVLISVEGSAEPG